MPQSTERIVSTEDLIAVGSGNRQVRVMKVEVGQRKALVMAQSHIGKAEVFVTLEEARALGKWLTRRVKQVDRQNRWQLLAKLMRFDVT
jgi:hypothetical protein